MSGSTTVDLRSVLQGLDDLQRAGGDLRPVFRELRPALANDLKEHFDGKEAPEGAWAPWSASYLERVLSAPGSRLRGRRGHGELPGALTKRGHRRLSNMLGRLKSAWKFSIDRLAIEARSVVSWAGIHQEGGQAGHGAQIPARVFAWASDRLVNLLVERAEVHFGKAWDR